MENQTCGRCGRKLKSEKSKKEGFGPVCLKKHNGDMAKAEQTKLELDEYLAGAKQEEKLKVGDVVEVIDPFYWYGDKRHEYGEQFVIQEQHIGHDFEKWVKKIN